MYNFPPYFHLCKVGFFSNQSYCLYWAICFFTTPLPSSSHSTLSHDPHASNLLSSVTFISAFITLLLRFMLLCIFTVVFMYECMHGYMDGWMSVSRILERIFCSTGFMIRHSLSVHHEFFNFCILAMNNSFSGHSNLVWQKFLLRN